jgi:polyhydroxyalkanoate synthase
VAGIISTSNNPGKEAHYLKTEDGKSRKNTRAWLNDSLTEKGSWWAHWTDWIKKNSGKNTPRRKSVGNKTFKPLAAAPGEYVKH